MTQATMERELAPIRPSTGSNLLVALVGLVVVFLLVLAMLGEAKAGQSFVSESNFLYVALLFFGAASILYVGFGMTGAERFVSFAFSANLVGFVAVTAAVAHRWYIAGRPPFSNIYEMLLSFVWTLAVLTIWAEKMQGVKIIGSVTMPVAVVSVVMMQLLPSDVRPLVPALQSTWLHIHVTLAMLSYAACAISFALAMMFLIQDKMKTESFLALTSASLMAVYGGIVGTRFSQGGLEVAAWDLAEKTEVRLQGGQSVFAVIPDLGWFFLLVLVAVAAPLALYAIAKIRKDENLLNLANGAFFVGMVFQVFATAAFILRSRSGQYASLDAEGSFATALAASPFLLAGMTGGLFASLLYLMLRWRREGLQRMMPSADRLDRLTYKAIGIGFPLLTLMIAAGAYWANQTWGSYWSWDPKETWAAITWIVYAGYLHTRLAHGWRGRRAAYFAIVGFAVVIFTFFGVTYLLPGMHAYA